MCQQPELYFLLSGLVFTLILCTKCVHFKVTSKYTASIFIGFSYKWFRCGSHFGFFLAQCYTSTDRLPEIYGTLTLTQLLKIFPHSLWASCICSDFLAKGYQHCKHKAVRRISTKRLAKKICFWKAPQVQENKGLKETARCVFVLYQSGHRCYVYGSAPPCISYVHTPSDGIFLRGQPLDNQGEMLISCPSGWWK